MNLDKVTSISDLQRIARRRVPRMFYDYADSGAWTEATYRDNSDAFSRIKLRQRVARNIGAECLFHIEMRRHGERVNPGIGASGRMGGHGFPGKGVRRRLERGLNRRAVLLALPADIGTAIIFQD